MSTPKQVQDEAAGLVVALLDPEPGESVLDACAAPGGKTLFAAARMHGRVCDMCSQAAFSSPIILIFKYTSGTLVHWWTCCGAFRECHGWPRRRGCTPSTSFITGLVHRSPGMQHSPRMSLAGLHSRFKLQEGEAPSTACRCLRPVVTVSGRLGRTKYPLTQGYILALDRSERKLRALAAMARGQGYSHMITTQAGVHAL